MLYTAMTSFTTEFTALRQNRYGYYDLTNESIQYYAVVVFSQEDKAVTKNDFLEKNWSVYWICKEHSTKKWNKVSIQRPLKHFYEHGSMDRRPGSGRPQTAMTEESEAMIEDLICSREEKPGIHMSPREIEKHTGISWSSVRRVVKKKLKV